MLPPFSKFPTIKTLVLQIMAGGLRPSSSSSNQSFTAKLLLLLTVIPFTLAAFAFVGVEVLQTLLLITLLKTINFLAWTVLLLLLQQLHPMFLVLIVALF